MVARKLSGLRSISFGALFLIMLSSGSYSTEGGIRLENSSEFVDGGRYDWTIYVVAEEPVLNEIDYVVYILHPSFPQPKRLIDTPENNFSLSANAWGEFLITAKVNFKNGEVVPIEHWLRLEANRIPDEEPEPPPPPPPQERRLAVENTANFLKGERWEWTIYIVAPEEVLEQIECVYYILHPSYRQPKREVCDNKGDDPGKGFSLTDTARRTFDVGVRLRFIDGQTRSLRYRLRKPQWREEYELVALVSAQNEKYVRDGLGGESYLAAVSDQASWGPEMFYLMRFDESKITLQSSMNNRYIRAGVGDESFLAATSEHIREWETFRLFQIEDDLVALQSVQNGKFVRAGVGRGAYMKPTYLAAVSPDVGEWELFRFIYFDTSVYYGDPD